MKTFDLLKKIPGMRDPDFLRGAKRSNFLFTFADSFETTKPPNILTVIAVPPRPVLSSRHWLHFITVVKSMRSEYGQIERLAEQLAPAVLQTGIVPIVEPLAERELEQMNYDFPVVRAMFDRGSLLYWGADAEN